MNRSCEEVIARCRAVLNKPDIIRLVELSHSPTAAFDLAKEVSGSDDIAKAARWLRILRRDYPDAYAEIMNRLSHATEGTAQKGTESEEILRS